MVNTDDFIKRLETILDYYSLNASTFADRIGVQRSSLSHLLSGRNKPSLDFILKIIDVFPDVDLYWILNGKGTFPKSSQTSPIIKNFDTVHKTIATPSLSKDIANNLFSDLEVTTSFKNPDEVKKEILLPTNNIDSGDTIEKIIFFYRNGTFKIHTPNS